MSRLFLEIAGDFATGAFFGHPKKLWIHLLPFDKLNSVAPFSTFFIAGRTMNKSQLVELVAEQTGLSKVATASIIDTALTTITGAVAAGDTVQLTGFGAFSLTRRKGRMGRNPRTGEALLINPTALPKFTAGTRFKAAVNASDR